MKKVWVIILLFVLSRFSFVNNATNFLIHSLNKFVLKKILLTRYCFSSIWCHFRSLYMLIYPLTACKLDWKKPLGFLCRINSFQNQNTYLQVNNQQQPLWSSNMRKGTYLDWTQTRYYATFKVRKFESFFYKIHFCKKLPLLLHWKQRK